MRTLFAVFNNTTVAVSRMSLSLLKTSYISISPLIMPLSYACISNAAHIFSDAIVTLVLILIKIIGEDILNVFNTGSKL